MLIVGGEQALLEQYNRQKTDIQDLVGLLDENDRTALLRKTIHSMIVQDIYMRDVTAIIYKNRISSENDFFWLKQMKMISQEEELYLNMLDVTAPYKYEYLGSVSRLVMTPVTEKSFIAILAAFKSCYYGILEGVSGIGKSAIVKDLASYLGVMYRVKNASSNVNIESITNFFKGVASSGCWALIEDMDRCKPEVMSMIAVVLEKLRQSAMEEKDHIELLGEEKFSIEKGYFVSTTINTAYIGRHTIPSDLMVLLRPVSIMTPDKSIIVETKLFSTGFTNSKSLSCLLIESLKVIKSQLPSEVHYNFSMRTILRIVDLAANKFTYLKQVNEKKVLFDSILEVLSKTLNSEDYLEMFKILKSFFPDEEYVEEKNSYESTNKNTIITSSIKKKILQVRAALNNNTGVIVVGAAFTAKSTILKLASELKTGTEIVTINPKALDSRELFGSINDSNTGWKDGLVSKVFKAFLSKCSEGDQIIKFDGPVDMEWIENFNTVLDDHKILTLESSECIYMSPSMKIVFEAGNLDKVSPATVSRCSVVYIEENCLTWKELFASWFNSIKCQSWLENHDVLLQQLFEWILPPLLQTVRNCKMALPVSMKNIVQCSFELFEILLLEALPNLKERKYLRGWIQAAVVYSCIWGLGGCLSSEEDRNVFDTSIREIIFGKRTAEFPLPKSLNGKFDSLPPVEGLIFEFVFDFKARGQWKHWNDIIKNMEIEEHYNYQDVLVPTIDSSRYGHILDLAIKTSKPFLLIGPKGTGKTSYMKNRISQGLNTDVEEADTLNLTPKITQKQIFESVISKLNKIRRGLYGPQGKKKFIMFLDNFGLPLRDQHGDQQAIELIHQLLDQKFMYEPATFNEVKLNNTNKKCQRD